MADYNYLAFDLGAESGRAIHGTLSGNHIKLNEIYRFPNGYINIRGRYHWNIFKLFDELKKGLEIYLSKQTADIHSIAVDTWGVDFGLLAKDGTLINQPYAYRDHRTDGIIEKFAQEIMPKRDLYMLTGIQLMQFNSIFQLYALKRDKSPLLEIASDLLFMPDLLNYFFTGIKKTEFSFATTSQLLNPFSKTWEQSLFEAIGINKKIMQDIVYPGSILGFIDKSNLPQTRNIEIPMVSVASHDTGSAIAAIPAEGENWAYLSSGTWSLMGLELNAPIVNEESARLNFTNEGGVEGTYRFLKNISGLWLLQQCKKTWDLTANYSYDQLVQLANEAKPFKIFVDTDAPEFLNPDDMPQAIAGFCKKTNQPIPANHSEYVRCIFDSLAMKYRNVLNQLKKLSPKPIEKLYVIGGGSKNKMLCQLTANSIGIPVITGPSEATAVGNLMYQAKALGHVSSLAEIRNIIRNSFESETYLPQDIATWDSVYKGYLQIVG